MIHLLTTLNFQELLAAFLSKLPLKTLQEFVENCKQEYSIFLKEQMLGNQYLITIENNKTSSTNSEKDKDDLKISKEEWSSNVTFDSRFFPNKEGILETINHFLNNGGGNLVNLASIQGIQPPKFWHYEGTDMSSPIEYSLAKSSIISEGSSASRSGISLSSHSPSP